jgi:hypothetical protein
MEAYVMNLIAQNPVLFVGLGSFLTALVGMKVTFK